MIARAIILTLLLLPGTAQSDDSIRSKGPLSDEDFHRLIACGATPGKDCRDEMRRWPITVSQAVTVSRLTDIDPVLPAISAQIDQALDNAIAQINGVGAAIHLLRLPDNQPARIRVSIRGPQTLSLISGETDPRRVPGGLVMFTPGPPGLIQGASIIISSRLVLTEINSVVLEELTQSLGLPYDISNSHYRRRSIFSQEANATTTLTGQDATAIRLHYPTP